MRTLAILALLAAPQQAPEIPADQADALHALIKPQAGEFAYDAKKNAFDRFQIVALGHGWGGNKKQAATTNFYRGGEHRRWPLGLAFELLTTDRPIDRIPPQNANSYRAGDAYFGRGR